MEEKFLLGIDDYLKLQIENEPKEVINLAIEVAQKIMEPKKELPNKFCYLLYWQNTVKNWELPTKPQT